MGYMVLYNSFGCKIASYQLESPNTTKEVSRILETEGIILEVGDRIEIQPS